MNLSARQSILATLSYFDLFDYPLTVQEIHRFLYCPPDDVKTIGDVLSVIESQLIVSGDVVCTNGLYTLPARTSIVATRIQRYLPVHYKYMKAVRYAKLFSYVPFIRMVAVCNELAYGNARAESDIDLYIVASKGYLWIVRLFCATIAELTGQRPNMATNQKQDAICLSFLVTDSSLDCRDLLLSQRGEVPDIQFVYWITQLVPLYDDGGIYESFWNQNNWIHKWIPYATQHEGIPRRTVRTHAVGRGIRSALESCIRITRPISTMLAKRFQIAIMPTYLKQHIDKPGHVVITDDVMKLHLTDKREATRDMFIQRLHTLL